MDGRVEEKRAIRINESGGEDWTRSDKSIKIKMMSNKERSFQ